MKDESLGLSFSSATALFFAFCASMIGGYAVYENASLRNELREVAANQALLIAELERVDAHFTSQLMSLSQSLVTQVRARSTLETDLSARMHSLERQMAEISVATADGRATESMSEVEEDVFAHIPPHDTPMWYLELHSVEDADTSELERQAQDLEEQAEDFLRQSEQARERGEDFETRRLQRLGYDARRDAQRLRARIAEPDLIVTGVDFLGRDVTVRVNKRWRSRLMRLTPGDLIGFRGRAARNTADQLEVIDASLLRDVPVD